MNALEPARFQCAFVRLVMYRQMYDTPLAAAAERPIFDNGILEPWKADRPS